MSTHGVNAREEVFEMYVFITRSLVRLLGAGLGLLALSAPALGQTPPNAGVLDGIQSQLENIEQALNGLQPGYVPFNVTLTPNTFCAGPGNASPDSAKIEVSSASPFLINSVRVGMGGIDETDDSVIITNAIVDGQSFNAFTAGNLVSAGSGNQRWFDVLAGLPLRNSDGRFPLQLAASGGGSPDIEIVVSCDAQTTTEIFIASVQVSGWKDPNEAVTVVAVE